MTKSNEVLFADGQLLKHWIATMKGQGWPEQITSKTKTQIGIEAGLAAKILAIEAKLQKKANDEEEVTTKYLKDAVFVANELVSQVHFTENIETYIAAVEKYALGSRLDRYILIHGYISWSLSESDKEWIGDMVVVGFTDDTKRASQHLIHFNKIENVGLSPKGVHCLEVSALTFWREFFQPSTENLLSSCYAVLVWY